MTLRAPPRFRRPTGCYCARSFFPTAWNACKSCVEWEEEKFSPLSRETGEEARARDVESETTGALVSFRTVSYNSCVWKGQYRAGIGQMKAWRAVRVVVLVRPPGTMEREKGLGHSVLCCRCVCESTTSTAGCLTGRPLLILIRLRVIQSNSSRRLQAYARSLSVPLSCRCSAHSVDSVSPRRNRAGWDLAIASMPIHTVEVRRLL